MLKWSCDNCGKVEDLPPDRLNGLDETQEMLVGDGDFVFRYSIGRKITDVERRAKGQAIGVAVDSMQPPPGIDGLLFSLRQQSREPDDGITAADLCDPCREHLTREAGLAMQRIGREVLSE